MNYTVQELTSMIYVIGSCEENCFLASRVYAQRFPERRHPDSRSLENLRERFNRTGSVAYEKQTRTKTVLNEENALAISLAINPRNKFHPYHFQLHQELIENDFERRIIFCQWAQNQIAENEDFLNLYCLRMNAHSTEMVLLTGIIFIIMTPKIHMLWSLNVWGGIVHNFVIGPHIFEGRVTGQVFLNFLINDFPRLIHHLPDCIKNQIWIQLDGAPPHFSANVRQHLTENFPGQWIGRQGPTAWPPRSPDLTPMDYFLWGTVKSDVYSYAATTQEDMVYGAENTTIFSANNPCYV
ncbi:hypothetical protein NQ315_002564 [Exocentrus adspersus]|uniref:DUF4817 domain-containing protein n=1 Tax=Exocentrus adspersus TaxID=1586481 RepID=A0AAV8V7P7_9CUCU|nr:hypothetical protein NQ315_002564 [Exocentrus adspersus]